MAIEEHLDVLNQGVKKWNKWRKENSDMLPDLRNGRFEAGNFCGANFSHVNFENATIEDAILSNSNLSYANLSGASLNHTNLKRTYLGEAIFNKTCLNQTKFHFAYLRATHFLGVNLSVAEGLDRAYHLQPSTIDIDTIHLSKGKIDNVFLRRAGVPDTFINYIHSLGKRPFDYHSCFISYASDDEVFVNKLYSSLQKEGVQCWLAPLALKAGDRFPQLIGDAIRHYDKLVLVLSKSSLKSDWVEQEVKLARTKEHNGKIVICPIYLDNAYESSKKDWIISLRKRVDIENFQPGKQYPKALEKLLEALRV